MSDALPIIESCENCGACCFEQQSPPGFAMLLSQPHLAEGDSPFAEDFERLQALPETAMAELRTYLADLLDGKEPADGVCIWLDRERNRCRYHEQRPSTCRDFEIDSPECHEWRRQYGIKTP